MLFSVSYFSCALASRSRRIANCAPVELVEDTATQVAAGPAGPPGMAPCLVAGSLTEWVFADETGAERAEFMSLVGAAATEFWIRRRTLGGSADAEELVTHHFSRFPASNEALGNHNASCRDWTASLRRRQP